MNVHCDAGNASVELLLEVDWDDSRGGNVVLLPAVPAIGGINGPAERRGAVGDIGQGVLPRGS